MTGESAARVNPFFEPGVYPHAPNDEVRRFHRSLPGYAPTPLHDCPGLAARLGLGGLFVKDEGFRFGLMAFKALGASWAIHLVRTRLTGPLTVSTATDGNHGRAVAWAARQFGCSAVVYIPAHAVPVRVNNIRNEGARVELVAGSYDAAVDRCARESALNGWEVVADVGYEGYIDTPNRIVEGYSTLFREIDDQVEGSGTPAFNVVVVQAGVGSLLHAAVDHYRSHTAQPMMVAVEPVESDPLFASINTEDGRPAPSKGRQNSIMAGLNCGRVSLAAWPTIRRGVELFLTVTDDYAEQAMRLLAAGESGDPTIVAGESGGAGLAGIVALLEAPGLRRARDFLRLGKNSRVLVINTEGATDPEGYRRVVGP